MLILLGLVSSRPNAEEERIRDTGTTPSDSAIGCCRSGQIDLLVVVHEEASFGMKGQELEWSVSVALWCPQASINRRRFFMELPRSLCFLNPDPASCVGSI
jgi:hypothetical protein